MRMGIGCAAAMQIPSSATGPFVRTPRFRIHCGQIIAVLDTNHLDLGHVRRMS